jgi:hypothetical protein
MSWPVVELSNDIGSVDASIKMNIWCFDMLGDNGNKSEKSLQV